VDKQKNFSTDETVVPTVSEKIDMEHKRTKRKAKPKTTIDDMNAIEANAEIYHIGRVTYFNSKTMIIGIRFDGVGYQTKVKRTYSVGDAVSFTVKNGEIIVK